MRWNRPLDSSSNRRVPIGGMTIRFFTVFEPIVSGEKRCGTTGATYMPIVRCGQSSLSSSRLLQLGHCALDRFLSLFASKPRDEVGPSASAEHLTAEHVEPKGKGLQG